MKQRLMTGLVAGGLMAAMLPGLASAASGPRMDHVTGSAKVASLDAHVWVSAHSRADGQNAHGRVVLHQGTVSLRAAVRCLAVDGDVAVIGAVVTASSDPALVGTSILQYVQDNGSPGTNDASLTVLAGAADVSVCPAATPTPTLITRTSGNWVVRDH